MIEIGEPQVNKKDLSQAEFLEEEFESGPRGLAEAVDKFEAFIKSHGHEDPSDLLKLGFDEAVQNSMGHGHGAFGEDETGARIMHSENSHLKVSVRVEVTPKSIKAIITNQGEGFDHEAVMAEKKEQIHNTDEENLFATGRGGFFMDQSYDVKYLDGGRTTVITYPKAETGTK